MQHVVKTSSSVTQAAVFHHRGSVMATVIVKTHPMNETAVSNYNSHLSSDRISPSGIAVCAVHQPVCVCVCLCVCSFVRLMFSYFLSSLLNILWWQHGHLIYTSSLKPVF